MPLDRSALARHLVHEAQLKQRLERESLRVGIPSFDAEFGGLPRGALTEVFGPASSGKTSFLNSFIARLTTSGEFCALVDGNDSFDPASAESAGAALDHLLWVRCHGVEQALKAADLLIHSGGFGVIVLDMSGIAPAAVRRIPMSWWYRFRRAVENTPTSLVVVEQEPFVKNCAVMMLEFTPSKAVWSGAHPDFRVLRAADIALAPRKPVGAKRSGFRSKARV